MNTNPAWMIGDDSDTCDNADAVDTGDIDGYAWMFRTPPRTPPPQKRRRQQKVITVSEFLEDADSAIEASIAAIETGQRDKTTAARRVLRDLADVANKILRRLAYQNPMSPSICTLHAFLDFVDTYRVRGISAACESCGKLTKRRCGRCRAAWYCSEGCQVPAWFAGHKQVCKPQAPFRSKKTVLRRLDVIEPVYDVWRVCNAQRNTAVDAFLGRAEEA